MKKIISFFTITTAMIASLTSCNSNRSWKLTNPDGTLAINIDLSNSGSLTYSVTKNNKKIVNKSALGMEFVANVNGTDKTYNFSKGLTYVGTTSDEKQFSYICHSGKVDKVTAYYKERVITTKIDDLLMDVRFRTLNDGYGIQYTFRKKNKSNDTLNWKKEFTEFNIPSDSLTYGMDYVPNVGTHSTYYSYETHYSIRSFKDIDTTKQISMPFGYETNGYYSFITESALMGSGYHGSFLGKNDKGVLATIEAPADRGQPDYNTVLPFTSPWRVSCVGSYATAVETTIVEDIQGEVEEYNPTGEENYYKWVEASPAAWSWYLHHDQTDFALQKEYVDLAKEMGWKYILLDAGWEGIKGEGDAEDLINYAHNKNLKVIVWAHAMEKFLNKEMMEETLKGYDSLGVDGIKVDFWDGQDIEGLTHQMEDKQTIQQYDDFYKLSAQHKMVVICHGCNKPTGEKRRYPHVINREAIRGNEMNNVYAGQGTINTVLRGVVGPTDFTPVVKPVEQDVTIGYQMALTVLLEAGVPSMADLPEVYKNELYKDYYKNLPAHWDKTKFLDGNPQTYVVLARKKKDDWWIAGITASQQRTINIDLSFLDSANYAATFYNGGSRDREEGDITKTTDTISYPKTKNITIDVTDNAGFVITLKKK